MGSKRWYPQARGRRTSEPQCKAERVFVRTCIEQIKQQLARLIQIHLEYQFQPAICPEEGDNNNLQFSCPLPLRALLRTLSLFQRFHCWFPSRVHGHQCSILAGVNALQKSIRRSSNAEDSVGLISSVYVHSNYFILSLRALSGLECRT